MSSNFLAAIGFFGVILAVLLLWLIIGAIMDDNCLTRRLMRKAKIRFNGITHRNKLFGCLSCSRYFRLYQTSFLREDHIYKCPHCSKYVGTEYKGYSINNEIKKPDKWTNVHLDCFKVSIKQYLTLKRTLKKVQMLREEEAAIQRFEQYNNMGVDSNWIEKLQKFDKG